MRELAVQSANGTLSDDDRAVLDTEFTALISEISRVAADTDFNGVSLFDGTNSSITLQIGADNVAANDQISISLTEVTAGTDGLDVSALSVATDTGAQTALSAIDTAIDSVTTFRGDLGAQQNRLQSVVRSIANTTENLTAAESRIRDVDVAYETADLSELDPSAGRGLGPLAGQPAAAARAQPPRLEPTLESMIPMNSEGDSHSWNSLPSSFAS